MSYRVYVDDCQIFGNNETYPEWDEFIRSQGIEIGEGGDYEGTTTDVKGLFMTLEKIIRRLIKEQHERVLKQEPFHKNELADFSGSWMLDDDIPILKFDEYIINNSYIFIPYLVYQALEYKLVCTKRWDDKWFRASYELKDGEVIELSAG